tara:strand:+ start:2915 stop:3679 length:765 start_codon:yes stop_codon:yes gene_type:complete
MKIKIIKCLEDNYTYLVLNQKENTACVVDPGDAEPIIEYLNKNKIKLKLILNTHHHLDHVGGNTKLKKLYKAKIIGFEQDAERIPGIDIKLSDKQIYTHDNEFEFRVFHVPGHTLGHICFHFFKNNILFTGDTLFSLGCGRVFEGTMEQMFKSLCLIKSFSPNTEIYCGHEYTKNNYNFCSKYDVKNTHLSLKNQFILKRISQGLPTIPVSLEDELKSNIFLRFDNIEIKKEIGFEKASDFETFKKLRELKDSF